MKPIEGRLQTAEHILAKIIEDKIECNVSVCKFKEDYGTLEINSQTDIRKLGKEALENETQEIINKNIEVKKSMINRDQAHQYDLRRIPDSIQELRVVDIVGFDARPCGDPHVDNTNQIGVFSIDKIKKVGKGRYRVYFSVG